MGRGLALYTMISEMGFSFRDQFQESALLPALTQIQSVRFPHQFPHRNKLPLTTIPRPVPFSLCHLQDLTPGRILESIHADVLPMTSLFQTQALVLGALTKTSSAAVLKGFVVLVESMVPIAL